MQLFDNNNAAVRPAVRAILTSFLADFLTGDQQLISHSLMIPLRMIMSSEICCHYFS